MAVRKSSIEGDVLSVSDEIELFRSAAPVHANRIELSELVAMFRRAATKGPHPDEDILADCEYLCSTWWLEGLAQFDPKKRRSTGNARVDAKLKEMDLEEAKRPNPEKEVAKALDILIKYLPEIISLNTVVMKTAPLMFSAAEMIDLPTKLYESAREFKAVPPLTSLTRKPQRTPWHGPAHTIAYEAIKVWRLAGRKKFSTNPTSPLVKFTQEFLAKAGVNQTNEAIAKLFQRGEIAAIAKRGQAQRS